MEEGGLDSDGRGFRNATELWREQIGVEEEEQQQQKQKQLELPPSSSNGCRNAKRQEWYRKGVAYWQGVDASVDGVLGGYGHVNDADVKGSEAFLKPILADRFGGGGGGNRRLVALDCGSGIGRITKNLLLRHFNEVDLVEPVSHFLEAAQENLVPENYMVKVAHKAVNFFCLPLQEFTPETGRYDVIWVQWCIGHLPDDDFVAFFHRAKAGLKPDGFFVLKENIARSGFVLDKEDQSITRSDTYFRELFQRCGLQIYKTKEQRGLPKELFAVKMYALVTEKARHNRGKPRVQTWTPAIIK